MSQHFRTIPIQPGPQGVFDALTAVHELFEDEKSVALVDARATQALDAIQVDQPLLGEEPSLILVTSGSTGRPRGVEISVTALGEAAALSAEALGSQSVWLTALPVTSMGGLNTVIRSALAGTAPVIWDGVAGASSFEAAEFVPFMQATLRSAKKQKLSAAVSLVPTQLHRLLTHSEAASVLRDFDHVLVGGSATSADLVERSSEVGINLIRTYGSTETSGGIVYNGTPLPEVIVSVGEHQRVIVHGPTLATAYRDGEFIAQTGWTSSDLGKFENGVLQIVGRADDLVKTAGHLVNLQELHSWVAELVPSSQSAVSHCESDEYGSIPIIAVAHPTDLQLLENHIRTKLNFMKIPLRIVAVDNLPLLPNGKADRIAISKL